MKVAINTIIDYTNYGNRLQNYALQHVIESLGYNVVTIRNLTNKKRSIFSRIKDSMATGQFLSKLSNKKVKRQQNYQIDYADKMRIANFKKFTKDNIKETEFYIDEKTSDFSFDKEVDCYVIGSDQVWNYSFFNRFSDLDFVEYSEKGKISYAASFGVSEIPKKYLKMYINGLSKIKYISVRESSGVNIVNKLCGVTPEVVLDPTLLLDKEEWLEIGSNGQHNIDNKYILTYFLGDISQDMTDYIEKFAKMHNCTIKRLSTRDDIELWTADPSEFIELFSNAYYVFTDSFHACVFSIIFQKNFEVFDRDTPGPSMRSRIDTLLGKFELNDRWYGSDTLKENIDYKKVDKLLLLEKRKSLLFLSKSLKNIESGMLSEE